MKNCEQLQLTEKYRLYRTKELLAEYYAGIADTDKSISYFKEAYEGALKTIGDNNREAIIPRILMKIGNHFSSIQDLEKALVYFQNALKIYDKNLSDDFINNPEIYDINNYIQVKDVLHNKAKTARSIFIESNDINYLKISIATYSSLIELIDKMRLSYLTDGSKYFIAESALAIYDEAMNVLFEYYEMTGSKEYLDQILNVIEKNKSTILFESIQRKKSYLASKLPQALIDEERSLAKSISFTEKRLRNLTGNTGELDSLKQKSLKDELVDLNEAYSIHNNDILRKYPKYHNLINDVTRQLAIDEVQMKLNDNDLVIESFMGEKHIFILTISKSDINIFKKEIGDLEDRLWRYLNAISSKPKLKSENIDSLSYGIYSDVLERALEASTQIQNIIFVSDGVLSKIPIEPLAMNLKGIGKDKYLIEKYTVTYLYSINQLTSSALQENVNPEILCLAPEFNLQTENSNSCQAESLSELPFAQDEVDFLSEAYTGEFLRGKEATSEIFLNKIANFPILHLATHACMNGNDSSLSEIHFSDGYLTNYDIENLNVQPQLVVLSACNTGQGEVKKGEGLISLSRGFFESGVQSLQSSLWSINDQSSSIIIKDMYANLKKGESVSNALRLAKLDYLSQADRAHRHPFYWAGIIHIGSDSLLFEKRNGIFLYVALGLLVLLFVWYKKK